jgi:hypothetical protein
MGRINHLREMDMDTGDSTQHAGSSGTPLLVEISQLRSRLEREGYSDAHVLSTRWAETDLHL